MPIRTSALGSSCPGACFSCGSLGHRQASCPKHMTSRDLLAPVDDPELSDLHSPPIFYEEPSEYPSETILSGDVGLALVLRRIYLSPLAPADGILRHVIFYLQN